MINVHESLFPNEQMSNKTLQWFGMDSSERLEYNLKNNRPLLSKHGWVNESITYRFNQNGFRGDNFTANPSIMFLGCSHTFGLGVPEISTWAHHTSKELKLSCINLGWPATSNDTAFRYAFHYLSIYTPKVVVLLSPSISRTDLIIKDTFVTFLPSMSSQHTLENYNDYSKFYEAWISSDVNLELNRVKNVLAIKQLCEQRQIKFVTRNWESFKCIDLARDLLHFGVKTHKTIADVFLKDIGTP